jgi:hypothetical protein
MEHNVYLRGWSAEAPSLVSVRAGLRATVILSRRWWIILTTMWWGILIVLAHGVCAQLVDKTRCGIGNQVTQKGGRVMALLKTRRRQSRKSHADQLEWLVRKYLNITGGAGDRATADMTSPVVGPAIQMSLRSPSTGDIYISHFRYWAYNIYYTTVTTASNYTEVQLRAPTLPRYLPTPSPQPIAQ